MACQLAAPNEREWASMSDMAAQNLFLLRVALCLAVQCLHAVRMTLPRPLAQESVKRSRAAATLERVVLPFRCERMCEIQSHVVSDTGAEEPHESLTTICSCRLAVA